MDIEILNNLTLLRALMIFAIVAAFLVFAGIVVCYKTWRDNHRRNEARTGNSSSSKQGAGNSIESIA